MSFPNKKTQIKNFLTTSKQVFKGFFKSGRVAVSYETYYERLDICHKCDLFDNKEGRCFECGCFIHIKARLTEAECDLKKW